MDQKFHIGDRVRVIERRGGEDDYKFAFTNEMAKLSGRVFTVLSVRGSYPDRCAIPDDGHLYTLKEVRFNWASSMLELAEETPPPSKEEPKVLDFTPKKKHYQLNFSV